MPASRTVHSPYPTGQGFASVPVLFSLPNVQPAIAAASTRVAAEQGGTGRENRRETLPEGAVTETTVTANHPPFEPTSIVVSPMAGSQPRTESWLTKLTSQMTNITIIVLLLAIVGLAVRNQQQTDREPAGSEVNPVAQRAPEAPPVVHRELPSQVADSSRTPFEPSAQAPPLEIPKTASNEPSSLTVTEPPMEKLVVEKGTIPLLLPPAPQESGSQEIARTAVEPAASPKGAPYGTGSAPSSPSGNRTGGNQFSLTSSKAASATGTGLSSPSAPNDRARWDAIDTDNPSLNTREIILLRNGQRRTDTASEDPGLPKVESLSRPQGGQRVANASNLAPSPSGIPMMTGQPYPPVPRQYEPISMPQPPSSSRITQPAWNGAQKPVQKQYVPLSPVLPNPSETTGFDNGNP